MTLAPSQWTPVKRADQTTGWLAGFLVEASSLFNLSRILDSVPFPGVKFGNLFTPSSVELVAVLSVCLSFCRSVCLSTERAAALPSDRKWILLTLW